MTDKQQLAKQLYLTQNKTQKEIALEVGVSERTVHAWVHQFAWNKLRLAACTAPITISGNLCSQLVEMQNAIAAREPGNRFPTSKEADVIRKMILCIDAMKKYPSLSQNMQMMETFRNYVRPLNPQFTKELAHYSEEFLSARSVNGFAPYQVEYGIENIAPFYDELNGDKPCDHSIPPVQHIPCPNMDNCLHPGSCNYPQCKYKASADSNPASAEIQTVPQPASIPGSTPVEASIQTCLPIGTAPISGSIPAIFPIENTQNEENPAIPQSLHQSIPLPVNAAVQQTIQTPNYQLPIPSETGSIPAISPIENTQNEENPATAIPASIYPAPGQCRSAANHPNAKLPITNSIRNRKHSRNFPY